MKIKHRLKLNRIFNTSGDNENYLIENKIFEQSRGSLIIYKRGNL